MNDDLDDCMNDNMSDDMCDNTIDDMNEDMSDYMDDKMYFLLGLIIHTTLIRKSRTFHVLPYPQHHNYWNFFILALF